MINNNIKITSINNNWLETIDSFLTKEECLELINLVKDELGKVGVLGEQIDNYRVANGAWICDCLGNPLVNRIKEFISDKTSLPIENQEQIHIVKYNVGGEYQNHHDFFHVLEDYYEDEMKRGGQRVYSCLIYLNDDFTGGETSFPNKNIKVNPEIGKMIIWKNMKQSSYGDYHTDIDSLHAGLPVTSGEKYIAIIWVRENTFIG